MAFRLLRLPLLLLRSQHVSQCREEEKERIEREEICIFIENEKKVTPIKLTLVINSIYTVASDRRQIEWKASRERERDRERERERESSSQCTEKGRNRGRFIMIVYSLSSLIRDWNINYSSSGLRKVFQILLFHFSLSLSISSPVFH